MLHLEKLDQFKKPQVFMSVDFYEDHNEFLLKVEDSHGDEVRTWVSVENAEKLRDYLTEVLKKVQKKG